VGADTAWALVLAGSRFHAPAYTAAGLRVARSVLANKTMAVDGHLQLVAGPWARKDPAIVDPSYLAPEAMQALASAGAGPSMAELGG
jgi:endo-1,4-beta-D-glucanase Y